MRAAADGSNIITASIGGASGWSEDAWAVVVSRIAEAGIPCPVSAGNDGAVGLFYASTAANGKKATAVASFDNWKSPILLRGSYFTVDDGPVQDFGYAPGQPADWAGIKLPLWALSFDTTDPAAGCTAFPADTPDLSGYIVLIRRGTCPYVTKAANAAAYGAKYIMYYNNVPGIATAASSGPGIIATGMVSRPFLTSFD